MMLLQESAARAALCLALGALLFAPRPTAAAEAKEKVATVTVKVRTILATRAHDRVDERLKELADQLKRTFNFTGFELKAEASETVKLEETAKISLPDPYRLEVKPVSLSDGKVTLRITVLEQKGREFRRKLDTKVTLSKDKAQLVGGLDTTGGQLVLAISAS